MPEIIAVGAAYLLFAVGTWILAMACSLPYQNKTDRLWKTSEDVEENEKK